MTNDGDSPWPPRSPFAKTSLASSFAQRLNKPRMQPSPVKFRARQKGQYDRAQTSKKLDPRLIRASTAEPIAAPMISCEIVPTISERAVEIRNQIENRLAINARANHSAASAQTAVTIHSDAWDMIQASNASAPARIRICGLAAGEVCWANA